jgi:hypothetical protein
MELFKIDLESKKPVHGRWQVDEVYIGALKHRMSKVKHAKIKQGTGFYHMQGILAFLHEKDGLFGLLIPDNSTQKEIQPLVKRFIDPLSTLQTDGSGVYVGLHKYFLQHESFNHSKGIYARDGYHTNTIEGSFKLFKDSIRGTYKQLGKKHLQRYFDEFCFRYNFRDHSDMERFEAAMKNIERRITYKQLTA